ncbi:MAG: T9SS type A sorting domain-containing protein [Bacteroidetes bacterium]|nr:MAG: T9SS type A sorting domain-containing protein [Bacteroidota bacterium]
MKRGLITIVFGVIFLSSSMLSVAKTSQNPVKYQSNDILRSVPILDYRKSTKSNVEFTFFNKGNLAHKDSSPFQQQPIGLPGCTWPRGTKNTYIYGMGICFGAKKFYNGDTFKLTHISYNPSNAGNWMNVGRIEDGDGIITNKRELYQVYFSDEFDKVTGDNKDPDGSVNWPLWKKDNSDLGKLGFYVFNEEDRRTTINPAGPAIISSQDVHCVFKDTDLFQYSGRTEQHSRDSGYPLRIQYEQTAYLYDNEMYKDMVIIRYKLINMSTDSLKDCWIGMISDDDLKIDGPDSGQVNDVAIPYNTDRTLNLTITWSGTNKGELGKGFGYIGNSLLESPAVDQNGYIRKDKQFYTPEEQLGLKTNILFSIGKDGEIMNNLYNNLSSEQRSINIENEDLRLLQATGPFNMNPNDTAICAFMINFASPADGGEATGGFSDIQTLITNVRNGRDLYYKNHLISNAEDNNPPNNNFIINKCYPNPASDKINIEFNIPNDGFVFISLSDILGNQIAFENRFFSLGNNNLTINTSDLPSGSYIIKLNFLGKNISKLFNVIN